MSFRLIVLRHLLLPGCLRVTSGAPPNPTITGIYSPTGECSLYSCQFANDADSLSQLDLSDVSRSLFSLVKLKFPSICGIRLSLD